VDTGIQFRVPYKTKNSQADDQMMALDELCPMYLVSYVIGNGMS
jgi:hypothetical protein